MKILFLSLRCPYPPHRGDRIRSYHFIKQLSQQHAVTLVYFAESQSDIEAVKYLEPFCERVEWVRFHRPFALINTAVHCLSRRPLQLHYWYAPQMQRKINQLLTQERFELIHAQLFRMGQYVTKVQGPTKVLDLCDSLALNLSRRAELESSPWLARIKNLLTRQSPTRSACKGSPLSPLASCYTNLIDALCKKLDCTPKRFLVKLEEKRVRQYEVGIMKVFDWGTVVAHFDRDYLLKQDNSLKLSVVPMGVDLGYFQPHFGLGIDRSALIPSLGMDQNHSVVAEEIRQEYADELYEDKSNAQRETSIEPCLLFTGTMNYFPNSDAAIYFCREIFPRIREHHPKATFYIVGNHPTDQVRRLAAQDGVMITGYVPDVRPYFGKASVFVAPLRAGSGIQTKNLEAMAMGVPVVTSSIGAMGLEADIGKELLVADTPEAFAEHVIQLMNNKDLRDKLAQAARKRVETNYSWQAIGDRLKHVYAHIQAQNSQ